MTDQWFNIGLFSKHTKAVNICSCCQCDRYICFVELENEVFRHMHVSLYVYKVAFEENFVCREMTGLLYL